MRGIERCTCGDTECPSCGEAQGTRTPHSSMRPGSAERTLRAGNTLSYVLALCACELAVLHESVDVVRARGMALGAYLGVLGMMTPDDDNREVCAMWSRWQLFLTESGVTW